MSDISDDWFRWIMGIAVAAISGAVGWIFGLIFADRKEIARLQTQIAVLQQRPVVDPIEYTAAITKMAAALTSFTKELQNLNEAQHELRDELRRIATDLDDILKQKKGPSL